MGCILSSRYVFKADVYKKVLGTSPSGQMIISWIFEKTINCFAEIIADGGIKNAGTTEKFDVRYENVDWVKFTSSISLRRSDRVTNIRNADTNEIVWKEEEIKGKPGTWFNSNGSAPITDPFGRVVEYKTLLKRAEVQGNGN